LLFNFALQCAIRKVQENEEGLQADGKHEHLFYADDVNMLGKNINIIRKNTESRSKASTEVGLEMNADKTVCMFKPRHQTLKIWQSSNVWEQQ
jgi:hypothetical protein